MSQKCSACTPLLKQKIENLLHDGDPTRLMEILFDLTDLGVQQDILSASDRAQLSMLNHLVGAVAREQCVFPPTKISS